MEKKTNMKLFWSVLVAILVVAVILRIVLFLNKDKEIVDNNKEIVDLMEANSSAVVIASSYRAQKIREIDESDIYLGSLEAPLQVIVYEDYSDKINASYRESIDTLKDEFSDKLVIAFRPFYISSRGEAPEISQALWCANDQDKFYELRKKIYERVEQDSFSLMELNSLASELEFDTKQFSDCVETFKYRDKVNALALEAKTFAVTGAPTTFIANSLIIGAREWEDVVDSNNELVEGLGTIVSKYLEN